MQILDELEEGNPWAWGALIVAGYIALNYWRSLQGTGQDDSFSGQAPADPSLEGDLDIIAPMHTSAAGQAFIKQKEGWLANPQNGAIGWGHTIRAADNIDPPITPAQGQQLFLGDLADAESIVNGAVTVGLSQNQFDALVDLAFNSGNAAFGANSTLITKLNAGDYAGASDAFALYNRSQGQVNQGLANRRGDEQDLFNGGGSTAAAA